MYLRLRKCFLRVALKDHIRYGLKKKHKETRNSGIMNKIFGTSREKFMILLTLSLNIQEAVIGCSIQKDKTSLNITSLIILI